MIKVYEIAKIKNFLFPFPLNCYLFKKTVSIARNITITFAMEVQLYDEPMCLMVHYRLMKTLYYMFPYF